MYVSFSFDVFFFFLSFFFKKKSRLLFVFLLTCAAAQTNPRVISSMLSHLAERGAELSTSPEENTLQPSSSSPLRAQVREALKSGLIPPEIEQDEELLNQFARSLLNKLRGFGSDLQGADGLNAINEARKKCNATTDLCEKVIHLLQERFVKRCETHCSCRLELTMYPRWMVSVKSMDRIVELRVLQNEIERNKSACRGVRTCIEANEAEYEKAASERRDIPEQLPELRKRLQKHLRTWESCPFDNSFDNCTKAKVHIVNARVKLELAYKTTIALLDTLNCSLTKYANCSNLTRAEISLLREEQQHNERMLEQVTFLLIDPTLARVNVAVYSILLVVCVGLLAFGAYWDVIGLFKKYTAVIAGIAVVCLLGVIGFSIGGLTGIARIATYELLLRV